jgi:hypothetical protein
MGWVVYSSVTGEMRRYYDSERSAQAQTKSHNTKALMRRLRGEYDAEAWSCLEWNEYEKEYIRYYTVNKPYILNRTAYY